MNRKTILFFIILVSYFRESCHAQQVSTSIETEDVLFLKYPNKIKIVVEDIKCGEFKVNPTNGIIKGEGCDYEVIPEKEGRFQINISYTKKSGEIVNRTQVFKVVAMPRPIATIANIHNGFVSYKDINRERYVECEVYNWDYANRYRIKSFTFTIQRRHRVVYSENVDGTWFTSSINTRLRKLKRNSKIIISNIIATGYNIEVQDVDNIVIRIVK